MKQWIWIILTVFVLAIGAGSVMWYRKKRNGLSPANTAKGGGTTTSGTAATLQVDMEKNLKASCIGTICPYSNENEALQKRLNEYLPRMNKILGGDIQPSTEREKAIRSRFDKLFIDGNMVLKFQTGTNQIEALKVDGKFGKKTEQMLFIATGKKETSMNALSLTLDKDTNQQTLFSLV